MSVQSATHPRFDYVDVVETILLPVNKPIEPGDILYDRIDLLANLDRVVALDVRAQAPLGALTGRWNAWSVLLEFAEDIVREGNPLGFPLAATIAAYVAAGPQVGLHSDKIANVFNDIDTKLSRAIAKAKAKKQHKTSEILADAEFETYYGAVRLLPFESAFSHKLSEKLYRRLFSMASYDPYKYVDYVHMGLESCRATEKTARCPSGETFLLANFASILQSYDDVYASGTPNPEITDEALTEALTDKLGVAGSVGVNLPDGSLLEKDATRHFAGTWEAYFCREQDDAVAMLKRLSEACADPTKIKNKIFSQMIEEKARFLRELGLLEENYPDNTVTVSPHLKEGPQRSDAAILKEFRRQKNPPPVAQRH